MRKCLFALVILALAVSFSLPALADAPDKDNVKLRVFVHYPKPGKPAPPVCNAGNNYTDVYGQAGWELLGPTVTYHVNYASIPSSIRNAQTAIRNSFTAWELSTGISFEEGSVTSARGYKRDGQNVVVWGAVPGGAIGVTYIWYLNGVALEVDTVMGKSLPWAWTDPSSLNPDVTCGSLSAYDVQDILTHEVGHWMGLDDLYTQSERDLTMYGYGAKGELKKDTLGTGDLRGLVAIY